MRFALFVLIAGFVVPAHMAQAADEFGTPFVNEAPSALSDKPYVEEEAPWDVEPAAGGETEPSQPGLDLPQSDESLAIQADPAQLGEIKDDLGP